eukprot:6175056-Pleurochrysis_carterae.AAC.1
MRHNQALRYRCAICTARRVQSLALHDQGVRGAAPRGAGHRAARAATACLVDAASRSRACYAGHVED